MARRYSAMEPLWRPELRDLLDQGHSATSAYRIIASRYGVTKETVAYCLDPEYANRRRESRRRSYSMRGARNRRPRSQLDSHELATVRAKDRDWYKRRDPFVANRRRDRMRDYMRDYQRFVDRFDKWVAELFRETTNVVYLQEIKARVEADSGIDMKPATIRRLMDGYIQNPRGPPVRRTRQGYIRTDLGD